MEQPTTFFSKVQAAQRHFLERLNHYLIKVLIYRLTFLQQGIVRLGIAFLLNSILIWTVINFFGHYQQIKTFYTNQTSYLLLTILLLALIITTALYKKAGLFQIILLLLGLGIAYGYGSRFRPERQPRRFSDYDLGLVAFRPVRLHHKRDPRILAARATLMLLTWRKVDLKHYPPDWLTEKQGILLFSFWLSGLLLPLSFLGVLFSMLPSRSR